MNTSQTKRRFDGQLDVLIDAEHLDLLDDLARNEQTTRADQARKAIAEYLQRRHLVRAAQPLTPEEAASALAYLDDIRARVAHVGDAA